MYVIYGITDIFINTASFVIIVFAGFKNQAKVVLGIEDDTEMSKSDYPIYQTNHEQLFKTEVQLTFT